ncbi:hypothetical protein M9H77_01714 [Catharanthus roseus]|uniref:Uncharacterized protein n=1 Tax=Catharanthus roseus TaxID=4058 RepID=A0ACC0C6L3_CATRO|nr:hypothetical protein M9H77_01714 [Catharanthus roseus]
MSRFWASFFQIIFLFFIFSSAQFEENSHQNFIVRVQNDLKPTAFSDVEEWYSSTLQTLNSKLEEKSEIGGEFLHVYKTVFHGFSARLTPKQAQELKTRPGVLAVLPDRLRQIQTTRSPEFLGLSISYNDPTSLSSESDWGSNVIIGVLDTGIWPERPSFRDDGLGPIPSRWKGECTEGEKFFKSNCNKKIIGARYFIRGYDAAVGGRSNASTDIKSARDSDGHGTHTASTAAGRAVNNASLFGLARGVAVGIAPKARIAAYKICWRRGCMDSDILAALDKAVEDGVDIISISVGGGPVTYNLDPIAIGSFAAMERGILISASAGNDGPMAMTVTNVAPWITSVGASTIDRKFPADLVLEDGRVLIGSSLYHGHRLQERTYYPLIYAGNASANISHGVGPIGIFSARGTCMTDSLRKEAVEGKIVVCDRGGSSRVAKGEVVQKAGGVGVVVANVAPQGEGLVADSHIIPGLSITESAANVVRAYINSNKNPQARMIFRGTVVGTKPAPIVAAFSARGPNPETPFVLKPDIIAPGVNILAAWPENVAPTELTNDTRRTEFNIASGTSMSCPHISGIAALLKGAHPDWSPAMIRSALMTTTYTYDLEGKPLKDEKSYNDSSIWAMGAGHVNPEKAQDPGLVYDISVDDYINFLCASNYSRQAIRQIVRRPSKCTGKNKKQWNLNYPAIVVVFDKSDTLKFEVDVTRTVTNVGEGTSSYSAKIINPNGATISVIPSKIEFNGKGEKKSYVVNIKGDQKIGVSPGNPLTEWGKLTWTDGKHEVVSPLVVMWRDVY